MKKAIQHLGMLTTLLLTFLSTAFMCGCSDDKEEPEAPISLAGTWICIETNFVPNNQGPISFDGSGFNVGDALVLFGEDFTNGDGLSGKKCFVWPWAYKRPLSEMTIELWNDMIYHAPNPMDDEFEWIYTFNNNTLTVMQSDLDRFTGTIVINDDEITYTYRFENWLYTGNGQGHIIDYEKTYVSKFKRESTN